MGFHAARTMWESNSKAEQFQRQQSRQSIQMSDSTPPSPPNTAVIAVVSASALETTRKSPLKQLDIIRRPSADGSPPFIRSPLPRAEVMAPPPRTDKRADLKKKRGPEGAEESDYSDVGDYKDDKEFYVEGVNDTDQQHVEGEWEEGETEASFEDDDDNQEDDDGDMAVVRQHSNFSRLSAQSWLTVDSAQDVEVDEQVTESIIGGNGEGGVELVRRMTGVATNVALLPHRHYPQPDRDPAKLFDVDAEGDLIQLLMGRSFSMLSVFECCALLQAGVAALKKKSFRRFGARRVWLSAECDQLAWTSKKDGVDEDHIKLHKVAKIKCVDRRVSIDVTEGYRISLLFADANEAGLCVRALSCLIPLQARIRAPVGVPPSDKEREDYQITDDIFNEKPLREYVAVNSYVVLCAARGQPQSMGNKLAFSKSDGSFCGVRYVAWELVPLLLRSQEEVAVLKRLEHPNVIKYHECLQDSERGGLYVVYEYLARGSPMDASQLAGAKTFPESTARDMVRDIANGLTYLHSLRIAHGDIRPENVMRAVDGTVKI